MRFCALAVAILLLSHPTRILAAEKPVLAGVIKDVDRGTAVWGALVSLSSGQERAVSDKQGRFSLPCKSGLRYRLRVELAGYEQAILPVTCRDQNIEVWLIESDKTTEREEIVITGKREKRPAAGRAEVSVHLLSQDVILDSAGAMEDPVRMVGTLPGALPASELTPLFFVRGGAVYESFFYLDDAIIYNPFQVGG